MARKYSKNRELVHLLFEVVNLAYEPDLEEHIDAYDNAEDSYEEVIEMLDTDLQDLSDRVYKVIGLRTLNTRKMAEYILGHIGKRNRRTIINKYLPRTRSSDEIDRFWRDLDRLLHDENLIENPEGSN